MYSSVNKWGLATGSYSPITHGVRLCCGYRMWFFSRSVFTRHSPHLVIKQLTGNTKPFILNFFRKHTSIELKRSVSYMLKKLVSNATCGNKSEKLQALIKRLKAKNRGKTRVITTHLWLRTKNAFVNILIGWRKWAPVSTLCNIILIFNMSDCCTTDIGWHLSGLSLNTVNEVWKVLLSAHENSFGLGSDSARRRCR
jgi:hypothetical protein